jgi:hypothetical protein
MPITTMMRKKKTNQKKKPQNFKLFPLLVFSHICDVKILEKFAPKIAKLVQITLEKHNCPKFSR